MLWHLLKFKEEFDWNVFAKEEGKNETQKTGPPAKPRRRL